MSDTTTQVAYESYVGADEAWIGNFPSHWDLKPVKHRCRFVSGSTPSKDNKQYWSDGNMPWVSPKDMKVPFLSATQDHITDLALQDTTLQIVAPGALLIVVRSGILQRTIPVAINRVPVTLNQDMRALVFQTQDEARYFSYLVQGHTAGLLQIWTKEGATVESIEYEFIANSNVPCPPLEEQQQIAAFLDYETAKIDALIEKQQQLIALLGEKRQAVISHAVTKGLNPDAPMRDSGIEWLGQVPEHWEVIAIKRIVSDPVTDGPHETPRFEDFGVPFLSAEGVSEGRVDLGRIRGFISESLNDEYSRKYLPRLHDIFMVKSGATTGVTAIVETEERFNIWSPLAVIRCNAFTDPYFTLFFMRSLNFQTAIELHWSFGTQQNIGMGVIENLHVVRPPLKEAKGVAQHLQRITEKMDSIAKKAVDQVALLQERRTALISAAVTGKIDVRGWRPPSSEVEREAEMELA